MKTAVELSKSTETEFATWLAAQWGANVTTGRQNRINGVAGPRTEGTLAKAYQTWLDETNRS